MPTHAIGDDDLGLRDRKKLTTRASLANAALELFEERGVAATTIDDITTRANVSRRTFFRYFPSKEAALIADPADFERQLLIALAPRPLPMTVADILDTFIEAAGSAEHDPDLERRRVTVLMDNEVEVAWVAWQSFSAIRDSVIQHVATHTGVGENDTLLGLAVGLGVFAMTFSVVTWAGCGAQCELTEEFHRTIESIEALVDGSISFGGSPSDQVDFRSGDHGM